MYKNYFSFKAIFNTTDILIKLQLFELSVLTLNLINDGNESNENEKLYYVIKNLIIISKAYQKKK